MKAKTLLPVLLAGVLLASVCPAQQPVRTIYRPWQLFWGDTTAYMEANWGRNTTPAYPDGRPLKEFFKEFELPITAVEFELYDLVVFAMYIYITLCFYRESRSNIISNDKRTINFYITC